LEQKVAQTEAEKMAAQRAEISALRRAERLQEQLDLSDALRVRQVERSNSGQERHHRFPSRDDASVGDRSIRNMLDMFDALGGGGEGEGIFRASGELSANPVPSPAKLAGPQASDIRRVLRSACDISYLERSEIGLQVILGLIRAEKESQIKQQQEVK